MYFLILDVKPFNKFALNCNWPFTKFKVPSLKDKRSLFRDKSYYIFE